MTVFQVPVYSECEAAIPRSGRTWVRGQEGRWQQKLPITGLCIPYLYSEEHKGLGRHKPIHPLCPRVLGRCFFLPRSFSGETSQKGGWTITVPWGSMSRDAGCGRFCFLREAQVAPVST